MADSTSFSTVKNGLQLKLNRQDLPFASLTYALSPLTNKLAPVDWTLLVTEDVRSQHIRCHELQDGDNLRELVAGFRKAFAVAVVLINTSDDYILQSLFLSGTQRSYFPVVVLTKSDGKELLKKVEQCKENVLARISVDESYVDTLQSRQVAGDEAIQTFSDQTASQELGYALRLMQFFTGEEHPTLNLKAELKKLMYTSGKPLVISEDSATFTMAMAVFYQHGKYGKPSSYTTAEVLRMINRHLAQTFPRDFPFHLVLAYKMHKKADIYKCDELDVFIRNCIEKMESMDSQLIAFTFLGFLQRCNFCVQFDSGNPTSVFQLLQEACLQMGKISHSNMRKASASRLHFYQRFVYSRFMWVSLNLRLQVELGIVTRNTTNIWNEEVIKTIAPLSMDPEIVAEVKKGLEFGRQVNLPPTLAFSPQLLANLFASQRHVKPFQHLSHYICVLESYICEENDFLIFVTTMRMAYDSWLKEARRGKLNAVSMMGTLSGALEEGLGFVDILYRFCTKHNFNPVVFDPECNKWVLLLLQLVDVTRDNSHVHLERFLGKSTHTVVQQYQDDIIKYVIDQTHDNFPRLTVQKFFLLYKAFLIWPNTCLEEYLQQYKISFGIRISDGVWKKLFSEVVKRFSGAHNHHYLLDFLQSVAEHYYQDGRAGDFIMHLLQLNVPKLFAVEVGGDKDEAVCRKFSSFLKNYILRCCLQHTLLNNMHRILDAISDHWNGFQQLVLAEVGREMIQDVKDLQRENFTSSSLLHRVLNKIVTMLSWDYSWLQSLSLKQEFCWHIIASCCEKIPIANKDLDSYCERKGLLKDMCLLSADGFPQEIVCNHIEKYFHFVCQIQAVLLEWKEKFMQQQVNHDEIVLYASQHQLLKHLAQTVCASSAIVDTQDILTVKNLFLNTFEQLNVLLIKYIPGQPDAKWCTLPSLLQCWSVALPPHLISQHVLFPGEERVEELLDSPLSPNISGIFQPGHDISLKLTKALSLRKLSELVQELNAFLQPIVDVMDMLVFFKLHPSFMFDKYLQVYLSKESEFGTREQHNDTTLSAFSLTASMQSQPEDHSLPLHVLQRAAIHARDLIVKLMQGTATYSDITAEGRLALENLNVKQEFSVLHSFSAYLNPSPANSEGLTSTQTMLELYEYICRTPITHSVFKQQCQLQGSLGDPKLLKLCQHQVQTVLLEWKQKFNKRQINYDEILSYTSQQPQLEHLAQTVCALSVIVDRQDILAVKNMLLDAFEQLNVLLIRYTPEQPDAKWCTLPSLLQGWGVALPQHLLDLISQHILFPGEEKSGKLLDNHPPPNTNGIFQPGHDISLKLTKTLSLQELSDLVQGLKTFLQPIVDVLDILVFFKLHPSEMFDKYLQVYLRKESEIKEQHNTTTLSTTSSIVPLFPGTSMQPRAEDQNEADCICLNVLQQAMVHTHTLIMKLMQGTASYSEIIAEGELNLEKLNIGQEFSTLHSFSAYLKPALDSCEGLAGVQNMLQLFQYVHHIRSIHNVCEQYQLQGLKDAQLLELCQCRVQAALQEWKQKFMKQLTNYKEMKIYTSHQSQLENLAQTIWASSVIVDTQEVQPMKNMFLNAFEQLNNLLIKYTPGQPDTKWCTLPSLVQGWGVALPPKLLGLITQHILFPGEEKTQDNSHLLNTADIFYPSHDVSLKLTKAISLHELSVFVEGMKTFLQSMLELMQELSQYVPYIQAIHSVCEQYQLQGCLEDSQLVELCQLLKDLNLEGNHAKVTPLDASKMMEKVKKILYLGNEAYLQLFTTMVESTVFCRFVSEKQFVGEKGQAVFRQQYQLITAQLQHEEYNETVLNHLYAAFKIIEPFMDTQQSFQQLMSHVTNLDVTSGVKQLRTVNSNITLIQLWFSRAEGDTLENVAKELDCILTTGYYFFDISNNVAELMLEYTPSTFDQSTPPLLLSSSQPSSLRDPEALSPQIQTFPHLQQESQNRCEGEATQAVNVQCWNNEQISDFVRKLGFLDTEKECGDKIKHFLHINETAHRLLSLSVRLKELGHQQWVFSESLNCSISEEEANQRINEAEKMLAKWVDLVDELRNQYHWLLFFSVPKMLLLYHQLKKETPNLGAIVHEISFLCYNEQAAWKNAQVVVEKSLHKYTESDKPPTHVVGMFLGMVFDDHSLPKRCGEGLSSLSQPSSPAPTQLLHYCPKYSQAQLIQLIVSIYSGVPEAFEVFRCHPSSTKQELSLFLKRVAKHPLQYLILKVNQLPFKLQEYLMELQLIIQDREVKISSKAPCLHLVETAPSILRKMPRLVLREHTESSPNLNFEEARKICLPQVVKPEDFTCVQLVYGYAGDGKTHYIKQQLSHSPACLTIAVNEAFTPLNAITKLRTLPLNQKNCAIFFNFTMLPPGGSVHEIERVRHQQLMEVIGWFFFDLLMLGYVEDSDTGLSFRIPGGLSWAIYVEVPSRDPSLNPEEALKHFQQEVPALGLLGTPHYIDPDTPYTVDEEVQLVCKYLKALQVGGKKGIDKLYQEVGFHARQPAAVKFSSKFSSKPVKFSSQPVKFSSWPDLTEVECRKLLLQYMPDHVKNTKITQRLFIKYMNRRCGFLEILPAFNYNTGGGEYVTDEQGKRMFTDTRELGSTLMMTMLSEVKDFCDPDIKDNWSLKPHQQLIYDFKDGGFSLGLITLHPDQLPEEDKMKFKKIGVKIPSMIELYSRKLLDEYLSRCLSVKLEDGRLTAIDDSEYVLTLDYAIKMLNIHERYKCGVPVIIEGETGVGKTALLEMLSKLWNQSLLLEWNRQRGRLLDFIREKLGAITTDVSENYQTCVEAVEALSAGKHVSEEDLVLLGQLPDPTQGHGHLFTLIRTFLLPMKSNPVVTLLRVQESQQQKASLEQLFERAKTEDSAESTARLLYGVLSAQIKPTFHKLNVHAAMTPADIRSHLEPVFSQAKLLTEAFKNKVADTFSLSVPFVTVFLDEVNASSCLGLFKEIIVDRTFDGNPIPHNVFIVAACNPNRGNSLSSHSQKETWIRGAYYVRQLHPTLRFLMWDYGSLDEHQERDYINAKMKMLNKRMPNAEVASLTELIMTSQKLMRDYAFRQLCSDGLDEHEARISSCSCVSQRDIQRVFTFYQWVMDSYTKYQPYGERQDYSRRAVLVALGIVYYMRLDSQYRKDYEQYLDKQVRLQNEVSFSQAFSDELNWYIDQMELPTGISKTRALKENLFATIVCTVTRTPLIIVGAPGSSKTLSFNLAIDNLKGQESKVNHFRDTKVFRSLDPHFYQCSRRTTSNEIQTVFSRAINRQRSHSKSKLPIYCVVFMDEAGLPEESHESLKVLHYHLDRQEVSFVAITNHVLDAAKTNRAVSLFRPEASKEDLETLAKGCLCNTPDKPPPEFKKDLETIVQFCPAFSRLMKKSQFRQYFGLRDFIHFVSYLRHHREEILTPQLVMEALERNFNGSDNFEKICNTFLKMVQYSINQVHCRGILEVLKDSLEDRPQQQGRDMAEAEVRYKLIIDPSEDDSLVRLLFYFSVLQRKETRMFMCSDFPGDSQLQKVNTIAAIRHSVIEGHTVVMTQTDDIHESFYDLFNQRFRKIDDPKEGARYYTNIAIGAHLKPSRVDPNFQCVVVVKKSEVQNTPAPFLNRFEKYCITHRSLLEVALSNLPSCMRIVVEAAMEKVQAFIDCISGSSSLYGLKMETLDSLVLSLLPPLTHTYEFLKESKVMDSNFEPFKEPNVIEEPPKEPSVMDGPPKEPSAMDGPPKEPSVMEEPPKETYLIDGSLRRFFLKKLLMQELLRNLRHCAGFNIPPYSLDELHLDTDCLFDLVLSDAEFEDLLPNLSHSTATQVVTEAMRVLHSAPAPQDGATQLSSEGCLVVALLQQWLVRYLCKRLMQLMTSEAFILYRNTLPSSYLENYLSFQAHFSLKELILKYHQALEHSGWNPASSPTKLLCFTRSSSLIHQLPAQYPSPVLDIQAARISQQTLYDLVFPDPSQLVVCTLSSLVSQSSMQEMLKEFVLSDKAQVCLLVVNMQETSRQVVNHLRIMIEEAELFSTQRAKLFVMLLHFPPAQFFDHCYPSLFLKGWDHCYLDTVAHSAGQGVVDIQDWLWRCCFPKETPKNDSLVLALQEILPEAIPVLYSRVFFGSNEQGSFNRPMNGSQRSKALEELLFMKGMGQILCEKFCSYWKPAVMTEYLERAAMFTKDHESTLNITDSIQMVFKGLFFDFLVYMLSQINDGCNIDVLFNSDCKDSDSKDSDSKDSDITFAVHQLFVDILQAFSLPKLSQLQFLSNSLPAPTPDHSPKFPFFKMVCEAVERIVNWSDDRTNVQLDLFQEEETESLDSLHTRDHYDVLQEVVEERIKKKMEATPKENLVLAVKAMGLHPELWQRYFDDFLLHKLQLEGLHSGGISQQVLCVVFQQLHKQETISHVISLHCYSHIYHADHAKMANLLQPLNQIQQTTTIEFHLLTPTDPEGEHLAKATKTRNLLGTPKRIATFVVNTLFAAIVEATNVSVTTVPEKMKVWFKAYRDLMTLSAVKKSVYEPLGSEAGELWKVVEAKLNVMQAVFLAIQTSPSLGEEILQKGLHIFQTLLNKHFTKTLELIGCRPNLEKMVSVTLKVISETTLRVGSVRLLVEGLFAHFFSPNRHGYHTEDVQWFLELANKQENWTANPLEHAQYHQPITETETNTALQIPLEAINMCVFKLYLGCILGPCDQCGDKAAILSAPLLLHLKQPRSQVVEVLMATPDLGSPAPYIPVFYQQCSSITPRANHENQRMQQPLAHLYFLTVLEHLQAQRHNLPGLVRTANTIIQQCASPTTESMVLWVELQAVVQVILQNLAVHLNPSKPDMGEVHPVVDDINRLLDDVETGGGDTNGHGMVLVMHLMKQLKSSQKLSELLTRKYDSICSWLHCLKPFHEQFTSSQWQKKLFVDIRSLELYYPHFPTEQDFIHSVLSSGDICSYTQKGELYLLGRFAQEWPRLQAGGLLLPDLVKFYQWLHTALAHQVTKERAKSLPIGRVVELAVQRYSSEEGQHLQALYNRVKDGYNQYVRHSSGTTSTGTCAALKMYNIADKIPLLHFLSDETDKEEHNDKLYNVAADIIAAHNTFIEEVYSSIQAQHLSHFLPDEPPTVYPSEVNDSSCIVGKLRSVNGINDFLQLIRSRYQPPNDAHVKLQTEFQFNLLQEDIVAYFLAGKPLIYIESLCIPFKFHQPIKKADVVGLARNVDNITEKLPDTFKAPLEESFLQRLEYEFHSASYHTLVEVVTGLRIVAGHLVKAVVEKNSEGLEQKTVSQFMLMQYDDLKESEDVLKKIGVQSTFPSQLVCLMKLPLPSLLCCLQLFASWVRDGVYDFAALPFGLKTRLSSQDLQSIEQIPLKWTGTPGDLLTEIKQMNDVLKHSEAHITKTANESAHTPLIQYFQEIYHLRMEDRLSCYRYIPSSILIQHYVYFRIAIRKLALTVQQQVKTEADKGDTEKEPWREVVDDLWDNKLPHLRDEIYNGSFVYDPQTGRYGFQEGSEYDSEDELMDDLMNEQEGEDCTLKDDPEEIEFYNDGAFVYDPQTGLYGFQEGLEYDSEEELIDDLVDKEEDHLPKGDADESFVAISEGQAPSVEFSRREKEQGTGHAGRPKESGEVEGLAHVYKDPDFRKIVRSIAKEYRDTQTLERSAQDCTPKQVGQFLDGIGLGYHVATFIEQDVSGDVLLEPDQEMLEELGVTSAIERLKIKVLFRRSLQGDVAQYPLQSVLAFLEQNKLGKYYDIFQESGIDGDLLLEADDTMLKELGVNSALDRKKIKTKYKTFVKGQH